MRQKSNRGPKSEQDRAKVEGIDGQRRRQLAEPNRWSGAGEGGKKKFVARLEKLAAFVIAKDFWQLRIKQQIIPRPPEVKGQETKGWIRKARALDGVRNLMLRWMMVECKARLFLLSFFASPSPA